MVNGCLGTRAGVGAPLGAKGPQSIYPFAPKGAPAVTKYVGFAPVYFLPKNSEMIAPVASRPAPNSAPVLT